MTSLSRSPDRAQDIVAKHPNPASMGDWLTVAMGEAAVLVAQGQVRGTAPAGQYQLTPANSPFLQAMPADVFFVSLTVRGLQVGGPVGDFPDAASGGEASLLAFGEVVLQVNDAGRLVAAIVYHAIAPGNETLLEVLKPIVFSAIQNTTGQIVAVEERIAVRDPGLGAAVLHELAMKGAPPLEELGLRVAQGQTLNFVAR